MAYSTNKVSWKWTATRDCNHMEEASRTVEQPCMNNQKLLYLLQLRKQKAKPSTIILYMQDIFSIYQGLRSCTLWDQKLETDILCTNCLQSAPYPYNLYILKLVNEWQSFIHVICSHSETTVTQCRALYYQELMSAADSVNLLILLIQILSQGYSALNLAAVQVQF